MKDIARRARVSIGTVSRVLNRHTDVDPILRERVEDAVRKVGYQLNQRTRSVVHAKSRMIGLILCNDFELSSAQSLLLVGVEECCAQQGYNLLFARHQFEADKGHLPLPNVIGTPGLSECLILMGRLEEGLLKALDRQKLNYVFLANHAEDGMDAARHQVRYDDETGCCEATRYLAQLGHNEIWYLGDESRFWQRGRYRGYRRAMAELKLEPHVHTIALSDNEFENGLAAISYILEQQWPLTAIVAASDELAFGVREGLRQHRKEVPRDVSLIGFEDQTGGSRGSNVTSVSVDMIDVGRQLAKQAIARIEANEIRSGELVVPTTLVRRSTCRPLRKEEHMLL